MHSPFPSGPVPTKVSADDQAEQWASEQEMNELQVAAVSEFDTDRRESTVEEVHAEIGTAMALVSVQPETAETVVTETKDVAIVPVSVPPEESTPVVGQAQVQQESTEPAATEDGPKSTSETNQTVNDNLAEKPNATLLEDVGDVGQETGPAPQELEKESHQGTTAGATNGGHGDADGKGNDEQADNDSDGSASSTSTTDDECGNSTEGLIRFNGFFCL